MHTRSQTNTKGCIWKHDHQGPYIRTETHTHRGTWINTLAGLKHIPFTNMHGGNTNTRGRAHVSCRCSRACKHTCPRVHTFAHPARLPLRLGVMLVPTCLSPFLLPGPLPFLGSLHSSVSARSFPRLLAWLPFLILTFNIISAARPFRGTAAHR